MASCCCHISPIPVVVLAGGKCKPELQAAADVTNKALVALKGQPMLAYVLKALSEAKLVSGVVVVGGPELDDCTRGIRRIDDTGDFFGNIKAGIVASETQGNVLIVTSDIPLLKGEMVDDFIQNAVKEKADLCYPIIPKEANEARFPGMKRTYVKLTDGTFTGGNMMLMDAGFLLRNEAIVTEAFEARKKPLKLARMLGIGLLFKLLIGRASIAHAERNASRMLNGNLKAVITSHPEIGADVDKPEDIPLAELFMDYKIPEEPVEN